jgi:hypothetical protein
MLLFKFLFFLALLFDSGLILIFNVIRYQKEEHKKTEKSRDLKTAVADSDFLYYFRIQDHVLHFRTGLAFWPNNDKQQTNNASQALRSQKLLI